MPGPPRPPVPAPPRSNVVPLRPAAQLDDSAPALGSMGGAAPMLAPTFQPIPAPPPPAPSVAADPFALPPTPAPSAPLMPAATAPLAPPLGSGGLSSPGTSSSAIAPVGISGSTSLAPPPPSAYLAPKKGGVPVWFWLIAVFVLGFGGAAALFFVTRQPPQQIVVQVPVPVGTTPPTTQGDIPPPTASAETPAAPTTTATGKAPTSKGGAVAAATPEKKGGAADVSGLLDGKGSGPNSPSPGGPGPSGGGTMDQAAVERVVASHRQGVKRTCWERAGGDQKPATSVTMNATVGPDGRVQSASSSGDDPVVAKCIENQVKSWQFPASGSTTPIQIPFKFVRQ